MLIFFSVYSVLAIPFRIVFLQYYDLDRSFAIDYVGDVIFAVDVVLRCFFFGFYDRDDVVMVRQRITEHYVGHGHFYLHLIALLPFDLLILTGPLRSLGVAQTLSLCRLNRLLRLVDLNEHIELIEKNLFRAKIRVLAYMSRNGLRLSKLVFVVFITGHISAGIFYWIAYAEHLRGQSVNWADHAGILSACDAGTFSGNGTVVGGCSEVPSIDEVFSRYVHSVYWAVSNFINSII